MPGVYTNAAGAITTMPWYVPTAAATRNYMVFASMDVFAKMLVQSSSSMRTMRSCVVVLVDSLNKSCFPSRLDCMPDDTPR